MKKFFIYLFFSLIICFSEAQSQSISAKIMDAKLVASTGELTVYLTDTLGISGVQYSVGVSPDTFNVTNQQYVISGNTFGNGTINNGVLETTIPGLNSTQLYYTRIRIMLDGGGYNEIEIHSSN